MNVIHHYRKALADKNYVADAAQEKAIMRLQDLFEELIDFKDQRSGFFKRMLNRPAVPKGVYMWGGVGRGKSFLMDSFIITYLINAKYAFIFMSLCVVFISKCKAFVVLRIP